jgi:hypothetical protein
MLAPTIFPEWLPPAVAREAERLLNSGHAEDELVLRLATDRRMQGVWRELSKPRYAFTHPQISNPWADTDFMDFPPLDGLTDQEATLTLFFWYSYAFAFMKPASGTVSLRDLPIARCRLEAARLRLSAARLRGLCLIPTSARDFLPAGISEQFADIYANNIEEAATFFDEIESSLVKLKAAEAPLVVHRDHGNQEARGYVRLLARVTRESFGSPLYGCLAKVASVALGKGVSLLQARKWCDDRANKGA